MRKAHGPGVAALLAVGPLLWATAALAQPPMVEVDPRIPFTTRQIVETALDAPDATVTTGESAVAADETRAGSLVHLGGTLLLEGEVQGNVLAVGSQVTLRPSAVIDGRLTVLNGRLYGTTLAETRKPTVWLRDEPVVVETVADTVRIRYVPPERPFPIGLNGIVGLVLHEYNGVDGLAFGAEIALRDLEGQPPTELGGGPVFRTERMEEVGWSVRGFRELPSLAGARVGGSVHSITDTAQRWHRPDFGNSLSALLFGNDDRAYHERAGYEAWVERAWAVTPVTVRVGWRDDEFDSLESETPLILFGGDSDWPINPPVEPGDGRALYASAALDRRFETAGALAGFYLEGGYEHWGFGGDFEFDAGRVDVRGYAPLGRSFASIRVAVGGRLGGGDTLAPQFLYRLGGAGSVVGYDGLSAELTGDRMALLNARFHLALPAGGFTDNLYLVGLADIGDAWLADDEPSWNRGLGAGLVARRRAYVGVFAAYGLESEQWHAYVLMRPWF